MIAPLKHGLLAAVLFTLIWAVPASAQAWFDLGRYRELKRSDRPTLEFVLSAMYESVFYAQGPSGDRSFALRPSLFRGRG